jgi:lipopolysaccharide biosynthesis protein
LDWVRFKKRIKFLFTLVLHVSFFQAKALARRVLKIKRDISYQVVRKINYHQSQSVVSKDLIIKKKYGSTNPKRERLCLFASYDRDGIIDDYLVNYLSKLHELDCDIVFTTCAHSLPLDQLVKIEKYCVTIIHRENLCMDFGSWKIGMDSVDNIAGYSQVILANDSVYGPFNDLGRVVREMSGKNLDMWGITDCKTPEYHLQSYFLFLDKSLVKSQFFKDFWNNFKFFQSKAVVIGEYEVGLSRAAIRAGFKLGAYCPSDEIVGYIEKNHSDYYYLDKIDITLLNSSHFFWKFLIQDFNCPFLKIELVRDNPMKIEGVDDWEKVVEKNSSYDLTMIKNHLSRTRA